MEAALENLVEEIKRIENEIKLLQDERRSVLSNYSDKLDVKAFSAAWSIVKRKERVDEDALNTILEKLESPE